MTKRTPSILIFVDFLDVIGRFSEMNPFILSKPGIVRKNFVKNIACTCMEYICARKIPNIRSACSPAAVCGRRFQMTEGRQTTHRLPSTRPDVEMRQRKLVLSPVDKGKVFFKHCSSLRYENSVHFFLEYKATVGLRTCIKGGTVHANAVLGEHVLCMIILCPICHRIHLTRSMCVCVCVCVCFEQLNKCLALSGLPSILA